MYIEPTACWLCLLYECYVYYISGVLRASSAAGQRQKRPLQLQACSQGSNKGANGNGFRKHSQDRPVTLTYTSNAEIFTVKRQ